MNPYEIPIVMYHSINDCQEKNPLGFLSFSTMEFTAHLNYFQKEGFEFITLSELLQRALCGKIASSKLAVLTFDDGFLDNYLIAAEILHNFNAKATIFVNPGHASSSPPRSLQDVPDAWGSLNFAEMRILEKTGSFEIQSHTLSHEDIFISDHLIDLYTPEKMHKYYWLVWLLHPHTRSRWYGDVMRYSKLIPSGYPIFEYGRPLRSQQFIPSADFIDLCLERYQSQGSRCLPELQSISQKGEYETVNEYNRRAEEQIVQSKQILERELSKCVEIICFPGDIYSDSLLSRAQAAGYKVFMRHPRLTRTSNLASLLEAKQMLSQNQMIGLQRFAFNYDYRGFLPVDKAAYWTAKFTVQGFQGDAFYSNLISTARSAKRKIKSLRGKGRSEP